MKPLHEFMAGLCVLGLVFETGAAEPAPIMPRPARPEWRLQLMAAAPDVRHPSVVASAPDGRIFVAEDPMDIATERSDTAQGRILCLHPDGRRTVFADGLFAVFGLQYLEGRLYVLHNPKFSTFDDAGDRGVNRVELIEQTNPNWSALGWNDHVPANFRLGMDGCFYVATGDKGLLNATGRDGSRISLSSGGIFRIRPDGTRLEVFATGVRNILDVAMSSEDELFTYDNTDEHEWMGRLTHMIDGGFYGYPHEFIPRQPHTLWCFADFGPGAATGALCYTEDILPPEYRDNLFVADFGKRQLLRVPVSRAGGSWRISGGANSAVGKPDQPNPVTEVVPILAAEAMFVDPPEDFRPVGITLAADGKSILICDWQHRDSKDTNAVCGRLWKLTWTGPDHSRAKPGWFIPAASGKAFTASDADLLGALSHPSREVRLCAQRRLEQRAAADESQGRRLQKQVDSLLTAPNSMPEARWHLIWLRGALAGREAKALPPALKDSLSDRLASVRRQALRAAGEFKWPESVSLMLAQLTNSDRSIRRAAATALGRIGDAKAIPALTDALDDDDLFARFASFTALNRIGRARSADNERPGRSRPGGVDGGQAARPTVWREIVRGLAHTNPAIRDGTVFAVRETFDADLLSELMALTCNTGVSEEARIRALQLVAAVHRQRPDWNGEWGAYHPFRTPPPAKSMAWAGTPTVSRQLRESLGDNSPRLRQAAIQGLVEAGETIAVPDLRRLFGRESDASTKAAALVALGRFGDREAGPLVVGALDDATSSSDLLSAALSAAATIGGEATAAALQRYVSEPPRDLALLAKALTTIAEPAVTNADAPRLVSRFTRFPEREVQLAAVRALGHVGGPEALVDLPGLINDASPELRRAAVQALADLPAGTAVPQLKAAFANGELRDIALGALARSPDLRALDLYLEVLAAKNVEQRVVAAKAITRLRSPALRAVEARVPTLAPEVVAQLQEIYREEPAAQGGPIFAQRFENTPPTAYLDFALTHPGDAARGRKLFLDRQGVNCVGCHRVGRDGGEVGPDLSGIGAQSDRRALAESVLFPNRVVREGYQAVQVELNDGEEMVGLVKGETADILTLRDATGALRQLARRDVKSRVHLDRSLMPDGLQVALSLDDFADLIGYLASLPGAVGSP